MKDAARTSVRLFYETFGWRKDAEGRYFDGAMADDWRALLEARSRLGPKALCVQADVTALPFRDGVFDGVASLHTVYHVPASEQPMAFRELHRTLAPRKTAVVVYAQDRPLGFPLPRWLVRVLLGRQWFARRLRSPTTPPDPPDLYFEPLPLARVSAILDDMGARFSVRPWRFVSVSFTRLALPDNLLGRLLLRVVFAFELLFPRHCGERGNYPTFVIAK